MKASVISIPLFVVVSGSTAYGFAPRPGNTWWSRTEARPYLSTSQLLKDGPFLQATKLLEQQETEFKTDVPFYAKPTAPAPPHDEISSKLMDSYQQEQQRTFTTRVAASTQNQDNENQATSLKEFVGLGTWIVGLSSFLLVNNFVGPWPAAVLEAIPVKYFGLTHAVAGMLFGGGIILTTLLEWLATDSKNPSVLNFYFDKVPTLDARVVLPALTASVISGVGIAVDHYGSLADSPFHVVGAISTLLAFAIWWALTDVTTQGAAKDAIEEWTRDYPANTAVPRIVQLRKVSNVVSCLFVAALYGFMVLKPGFTPPMMS